MYLLWFDYALIIRPAALYRKRLKVESWFWGDIVVDLKRFVGNDVVPSKQRLSVPHLIFRISSAPKRKTTRWVVFLFGGLEGIRTLDPHNANVVRYHPVK